MRDQARWRCSRGRRWFRVPCHLGHHRKDSSSRPGRSGGQASLKDQHADSVILGPLTTHLVIQDSVSAQGLEREVQQGEARSALEWTVDRPPKSRSRVYRVVASLSALFVQQRLDLGGRDRDRRHDDFGVAFVYRGLLYRHRDRVAIVRDEMAFNMLRVATSVPMGRLRSLFMLGSFREFQE